MSELRVLVTGAGRGIGRAIALEFARHGAKVAVAARTSDQLDEVVAEIDAAGGKGLALQTNVREHGSVEGSVYRAIEFTGGALDVLVNNAGVFDVKTFNDTDPALWQRHIEVNLTGAYFVTREAMDGLEESDRGHIFNIASVAAQEPFAGCTAYCASKYGLRGFSDALRLDLEEKKIRVSTIYPGATDTDIFDGVAGDWDRSQMNKPEDVAKIVWETYNAADGTDVADVNVPPPR